MPFLSNLLVSTKFKSPRPINNTVRRLLRKVKLYGPLADFVVERGGQETMEADISTPAEAIRFLVANWPELQGHMAEQYYKVSTSDFDLEQKDRALAGL